MIELFILQQLIQVLNYIIFYEDQKEVHVGVRTSISYK